MSESAKCATCGGRGLVPDKAAERSPFEKWCRECNGRGYRDMLAGEAAEAQP